MKKTFDQIWENNKKIFGTKDWKTLPDFLYFIDIPLPQNLWIDFQEKTEDLRSFISVDSGIWIPAELMHITIALPAREGFHFQGNDEARMRSVIEKITKETESFKIKTKKLNCFPEVLFWEILDEGNLYDLHKKIQKEIPFSQTPTFAGENYVPHMAVFYGKAKIKEGAEEVLRKDFEKEITVEKIVFGRAKNDKGYYERQNIKEFLLKR